MNRKKKSAYRNFPLGSVFKLAMYKTIKDPNIWWGSKHLFVIIFAYVFWNSSFLKEIIHVSVQRWYKTSMLHPTSSLSFSQPISLLTLDSSGRKVPGLSLGAFFVGMYLSCKFYVYVLYVSIWIICIWIICICICIWICICIECKYHNLPTCPVFASFRMVCCRGGMLCMTPFLPSLLLFWKKMV